MQNAQYDLFLGQFLEDIKRSGRIEEELKKLAEEDYFEDDDFDFNEIEER